MQTHLLTKQRESRGNYWNTVTFWISTEQTRTSSLPPCKSTTPFLEWWWALNSTHHQTHSFLIVLRKNSSSRICITWQSPAKTFDFWYNFSGTLSTRKAPNFTHRKILSKFWPNITNNKLIRSFPLVRLVSCGLRTKYRARLGIFLSSGLHKLLWTYSDLFWTYGWEMAALTSY